MGWYKGPATMGSAQLLASYRWTPTNYKYQTEATEEASKLDHEPAAAAHSLSHLDSVSPVPFHAVHLVSRLSTKFL
jgi:hypothetical protein